MPPTSKCKITKTIRRSYTQERDINCGSQLVFECQSFVPLMFRLQERRATTGFKADSINKKLFPSNPLNNFIALPPLRFDMLDALAWMR
jgi:hypothetical protein